MYTLIGTAKLNDIDPQAWLADVLDRIAEQPQTRLHELLPWHWKAERQQALAAAAFVRCLQLDRSDRRRIRITISYRPHWKSRLVAAADVPHVTR